MNKIKKDKDTIFIIGSGKSLNKIDISKLKDCNTFSMNRQYIAYSEWGFIPTYYLVIDSKLINTIHKDIETVIKEKKEIKNFFIMKHPDNKMCSWVNNVRKKEKRVIGVLPGGGENIPGRILDLNNKKVNFCGNAGACAVSIARALGYKKIVLLGIDAHYVSREDSLKANEDLSHFHPSYFDVKTFKEGVNQGADNHNSGTKYWKIIANQQKEIPNLKIISSSPDSPINEFLEYVEFDDLFK